jgi:hypothetical protein
MTKLDKTGYERYLNEYGLDEPQYNRRGTPIKHYGTWLRRNDPVAFNVGYNEWILREVYQSRVVK